MTDIDIDSLLNLAGFDPDESVLTRRQAAVLALREREFTQSSIADRFGTSRANVASIESSARQNVAKARETVVVAEALHAPVQISIDPDTDLYDVPPMVFEACDDADLKVPHTQPELLSKISEEAGDAVVGREIKFPLSVSVSADGSVTVRRQRDTDA